MICPSCESPMMTREVSAPFGSYGYLSTCVERKCGKKVTIDSNIVENNFIGDLMPGGLMKAGV